MFTGIVTEIGCVESICRTGDWTVRIATDSLHEGLQRGASIACHGLCLTVLAVSPPGQPGWFEVQVSRRTASVTNVHDWQPGSRINLERALRIGDELGGHIVTGHVDGLARVRDREESAESVHFHLDCPATLARYIPAKASVALNGVSLTVTDADAAGFGVNIIPHTLKATSWGTIGTGETLNLEIDPLARYIERLHTA